MDKSKQFMSNALQGLLVWQWIANETLFPWTSDVLAVDQGVLLCVQFHLHCKFHYN